MTDFKVIYCVTTKETIKVSLVSNLIRFDPFVKYYFRIARG
jgi:hypothetical protein